VGGTLKPGLALAIVLVVATAAFLPCLGNGFVDWDDDVLVVDNPYVQSLSRANVAAVFSRPVTNAYHPLTFLAWALEYRLWGAAPFGYHLVSLALHLAVVALVFLWIRELEGSVAAAAVAALFFGVHPMRAESVAWVSDQKDLLAALFSLAALLAWERSFRGNSRRWYPAALGFFLLAGLSKATAVVLPAVLLLADFLKCRPIDRRSVRRMVPFFALAGLFGLAAVVFRGRFEAFIGKELWQEAYPSAYRLYLVGHRFVFYFIQRTVAPTRGIESLYPVVGGPYLPGLIAWGAALALLAAGVAYSARFTRKGIFGAGFFVIALAPALATVSYGYTADRFSYFPSIGLSYLVGVTVAAALRTADRRLGRALVVASCVAAFSVMAATTWRQCGVWKDSVSLWSDAVDKFRGQPDSVNLGAALTNRGRARLALQEPQLALRDLEEAVPIAPLRHRALFFRAIALAALGERERALGDLEEALRIAPDYEQVRAFLGELAASEPGAPPVGGR
jgi:protein O-mannosyl-transferase